MKRPIAERENLVNAYVNGKMGKERTAELLGCTPRTVGNYAFRYIKEGTDGLVDHRHSNHYKLSPEQQEMIVKLKLNPRVLKWRLECDQSDYARKRLNSKHH